MLGRGRAGDLSLWRGDGTDTEHADAQGFGRIVGRVDCDGDRCHEDGRGVLSQLFEVRDTRVTGHSGKMMKGYF